jgi:hypothetical protein
MLRVSYEDLVAAPEPVLRRVCGFCALDFEPAMLASPGGRGAEYSDFYSGIHANVDRPATTDFVDRWERDLTERQVEVVESVAGELMARLGYPRVSGGAAPLPSPLRRRLDRASGMASQTYRYLRFRPRYLAFLLYRKARLGLLREFFRSVNY